ncbi:hypothetical protein JCM10207_009215 [Rhodosporidiobolus poonsookiae]
MKSPRPASKPVYTVPDAFLELERDHRRQEKAIKGRGRSGKSGGSSARSKQAEDSSTTSDGGEEVDQLASDLEDAAMMDDSRQKKRKKRVSGGSSKGKEAEKDRLSTLPAELLEQVFSHSSLSSLLALASTSKRLRNSLVSSAGENWSNARVRLKLPDLEAGDMSEEQYATLVFGRKCTGCGKTSAAMADFFLRMHLCVPCRTAKLVNVRELKKTRPDLHPAAASCVLTTSQIPSQPSHLATSAHYALLADIENEDTALWKRQDRDAPEEEARIASLLSAKAGAASSHSRPHEVAGAVGLAYSFSVGRGDGEWTPRVKKYVARRREKLDPLEKERRSPRLQPTQSSSLVLQEGKKLFDAVAALPHDEIKPVQKQDGPYQPNERRSALEKRLLEQDKGYEAQDFSGAWTTSKLVNEGDADLDDAAFELIKPKLVKILDAAKAKRLNTAYVEACRARQNALQPFYTKLRSDETYFPLFADFLLLPSVRHLWLSKDIELDDAACEAAREDVKEELNEWRVAVRQRALQLVMTASVEIPDDEDFSADMDDYEEYDEEAFELASAALVCTIAGCHRQTSKNDPARSTFFGDLFSLLAHQHADHSGLDLPSPSYAKKHEPAYHFDLPLPVANAVAALCEVVGLVYEEATLEDLDDKFEEDEQLRICWWDGMKKKGSFEREWRKVICHIKREADKAAKAKRVLIPAIEREAKRKVKKGRKSKGE